jgi:hypothetical protein
MSTSASATSIRHEVLVEAPIERAFSVFTDGFGRFKPREHNLLSADIAQTIFEPRAGGHIYDRGVDGSECRWARVLTTASSSLGHQPALADRDRHRGRGALHRRISGPDARRARTPQPRSPRRRLGSRPRRRRLRRRLAAVPTRLPRRSDP